MAIRAAPVDTPEPFRGGWRVASASGPGWHFVRLQPRPQCTCSFFVFGHGAPCRHIRAVRKLVDERGDDA
jgi:hypothetical protein